MSRRSIHPRVKSKGPTPSERTAKDAQVHETLDVQDVVSGRQGMLECRSGTAHCNFGGSQKSQGETESEEGFKQRPPWDLVRLPS